MSTESYWYALGLVLILGGYRQAQETYGTLNTLIERFLKVTLCDLERFSQIQSHITDYITAMAPYTFTHLIPMY